MKLYRYILRESIYLFFLSLFVFTFLLVLNRFSKLTELVLQRGVEIKDIVLLFLYSSSSYLTFSLPMSFLLSVVIVLGRLSSENEIMILKTSGVNVNRLFVPVLCFGTVVAFLSIINTSFLLPQSTEKLKSTLIDILKKGVFLDEKEGIFNDSIPGVVIYIERIDREKNSMEGILVSDERNSDIKQLITAKKGNIMFDSATLEIRFNLENGDIHRWEKGGDVYRNFVFKNYSFFFNVGSIIDPTRIFRKRPFEMGYDELREKIRNVPENQRYELLFEMHKKMFISLSPIFFTILVVPLGIQRKSGGKFSGILYSLCLFLFYYLLMAFSEKMGKNTDIPPLFMAFLPNFAIGVFGLYLSRDLNKEKTQGFVTLKRLFGL